MRDIEQSQTALQPERDDDERSTPLGQVVPRPDSEQLTAAVIFAAATALVALIGWLVTSANQDWFDELIQPGISPPGAVFTPVWSIMYVVIAAAGWLAWRATRTPVPTVTWAVQMALNLLWTSVFFGMQSTGGGMIVISALFAAVIIAGIAAWRANVLAGALFVPYIAWIAFAFVLNAGYAAENIR